MNIARILLVEDDAVARALQAEILEEAGYELTAVARGAMAIKCLEEASAAGQPFGLVVTDIYLDEVSGLDVLSAVQRMPSPPAVVLLTGAGSLETAIVALRHGAFDYLLKPVEPNKLLATVATVLERRAARQAREAMPHAMADGLEQHNALAVNDAGEAPARERNLQVGPLVLDTDRHAARWSEHALAVTPIEYGLLRFLAETPGRVRTYSEIVAWTHGHHINEGEAKLLIKSHVRNLRRKIGIAHLVHVRGAGYMLQAEPQADGATGNNGKK